MHNVATYFQYCTLDKLSKFDFRFHAAYVAHLNSSTINASKNDSVTLSCDYWSFVYLYPPPTAFWYNQDGVVVHYGVNYTIHNAGLGDIGHYYCKIRNSYYMNPIRKNVTLYVFGQA